jgi:hypothetical protein
MVTGLTEVNGHDKNRGYVCLIKLSSAGRGGFSHCGWLSAETVVFAFHVGLCCRIVIREKFMVSVTHGQLPILIYIMMSCRPKNLLLCYTYKP